MEKVIEYLQDLRDFELHQVGMTPLLSFKGTQEEHDNFHLQNAKDYEDEENTYSNSIDSLYSLIFSKGIHLFKNPFNIENCFEPKYYSEKLKAEQKTFYNPYIFMICTKQQS